MIEFMIPLVECWLPLWNEYILDFFCLAFIAFVGCFIHYLVRR